jgi:hypothetical protein
MHFGKRCDKLFRLVGLPLEGFCYRAWKKRMAGLSTRSASAEFLDELAAAMWRLDAAWLREAGKIRTLGCIPCTEHTLKHVHKLIGYADILREAIRKLLKKYKRRGKTDFIEPRSMNLACWTSLMRRRLDAIVRQRPLHIVQADTCAICLDVLPLIQLACGHRLCVSCVQQLRFRASAMDCSPQCALCREVLFIL